MKILHCSFRFALNFAGVGLFRRYLVPAKSIISGQFFLGRSRKSQCERQIADIEAGKGDGFRGARFALLSVPTTVSCIFLFCLGIMLPTQHDRLAANALSLEPLELTCKPAGEQPIMIENVSVLPMTTSSAVIHNATVILENGRIKSIMRLNENNYPLNVRRIDGSGKWLIPGLADMHVHIENPRMINLLSGPNGPAVKSVNDEDVLLPYLANGVLQVLNLGAMSESVGQRDGVESGRILGPHIALAAMVDGANPIWPIGFTRVAATPEDGRQVVRDIKAEGYDFVKIYSGLDYPTFEAIIDEAEINEIKIVGHIPGRRLNQTEKFLRPGFDLVAHAEEFAFQASDVSAAERSIEHYVKLAKQSNTWLISTLTLDERIDQQMTDFSSVARRPELPYIHPGLRYIWLFNNGYENSSPERKAMVKNLVRFNRKLVKAFFDAGIPVLAGTDAGVPGVAPGFSLPDEFEALARAGLPNEEILFANTYLAASWLNVLSDRGTIEPGKRADLVLLDGDPTIDISNIRKIDAVFLHGRHISRAELDTMMGKLAQKYRPEGESNVDADCTATSNGRDLERDSLH